MSKLNALIQISVPGFTRITSDRNASLEDNPEIRWLTEVVNGAGITWEKIDDVAGWGCWNQDWIEFTCEIETSWSWCIPCFFTAGSFNRENFLELLNHGKLIMMVHYVTNDGYIPHH